MNLKNLWEQSEEEIEIKKSPTADTRTCDFKKVRFKSAGTNEDTYSNKYNRNPFNYPVFHEQIPFLLIYSKAE